MTSGNLQFLVSLLNTCETGNEMLEVLEDIVNGEVEYFGAVSYTHLTLPTIYSV